MYPDFPVQHSCHMRTIPYRKWWIDASAQLVVALTYMSMNHDHQANTAAFGKDTYEKEATTACHDHTIEQNPSTQTLRSDSRMYIGFRTNQKAQEQSLQTELEMYIGIKANRSMLGSWKPHSYWRIRRTRKGTTQHSGSKMVVLRDKKVHLSLNTSF